MELKVPEKISAQLKQRVLDSLRSEPPTANAQYQVTTMGEALEQPVRYFVYADLLKELIKAGRYRNESATAILMGQFCIDDDGPFIEVTAFRELQYLYGGDSVELTRPALDRALEKLESEEEGRRQVVGVFVARPGSEACIDEEVVRLHLSLFNRPFQVAVVIDGVDDRVGLYGRAMNRPFFNAQFELVEAREEAADLPPKMEAFNEDHDADVEGDEQLLDENDEIDDFDDNATDLENMTDDDRNCGSRSQRNIG